MAKQAPYTEVFFLRSVRVRADDFKKAPEENVPGNELMRIVTRGETHWILTPAAVDMRISESVCLPDETKKIGEAREEWRAQDAAWRAKEKRLLEQAPAPNILAELSALRAEVAALKKKAA